VLGEKPASSILKEEKQYSEQQIFFPADLGHPQNDA
jgi:hypothetical protein